MSTTTYSQTLKEVMILVSYSQCVVNIYFRMISLIALSLRGIGYQVLGLILNLLHFLNVILELSIQLRFNSMLIKIYLHLSKCRLCQFHTWLMNTKKSCIHQPWFHISDFIPCDNQRCMHCIFIRIFYVYYCILLEVINK